MQFHRLIGSTNLSAMRAYGSILASGSRCDMLEAAAEIELHNHTLKTFKTCIQDVRRLASTRNLLVHGVVVSIANDEWTTDDPRVETEGPFLLMAAPYNKSKFELPATPSYIYSADTIEEVGCEIQKMMARIGALNPGADFHRYWRFSMR